jgi:hypothetical protein
MVGEVIRDWRSLHEIQAYDGDEDEQKAAGGRRGTTKTRTSSAGIEGTEAIGIVEGIEGIKSTYRRTNREKVKLVEAGLVSPMILGERPWGLFYKGTSVSESAWRQRREMNLEN